MSRILNWNLKMIGVSSSPARVQAIGRVLGRHAFRGVQLFTFNEVSRRGIERLRDLALGLSQSRGCKVYYGSTNSGDVREHFAYLQPEPGQPNPLGNTTGVAEDDSAALAAEAMAFTRPPRNNRVTFPGARGVVTIDALGIKIGVVHAAPYRSARHQFFMHTCEWIARTDWCAGSFVLCGDWNLSVRAASELLASFQATRQGVRLYPGLDIGLEAIRNNGRQASVSVQLAGNALLKIVAPPTRTHQNLRSAIDWFIVGRNINPYECTSMRRAGDAHDSSDHVPIVLGY